MRFAHLGDTHLGKKAKIKEREKDFEIVFERTIDSIVEKQVDFVIHSGDLFDTGNPGIEPIIFCMQQLSKLKQKNIPFYVIKGSHDVGFGETKTIIDVLEHAGLLINISHPRYMKENELHCEKVGNACIYGVWGRKSKIKELYKELKVNLDNNCYNIFLFHQAISSIMGSEMFADIETTDLPVGFDYYASGHWHGREELKYNGSPVIYPGSLENCNMDEMIRNDAKGYYLVDTESKEYNLIKIKSREVKLITIQSENNTAEDLMEKAINSIEKVEDRRILVIKFKGRIKGKRAKIDKGYLSKIASEKGYLFANFSLSKLKEEEEKGVEIKQTNVNEIEKEYLVAKGYEGNEVQLAQEIMEILGKKLTATQLDPEIEKAKELIERYSNAN